MYIYRYIHIYIYIYIYIYVAALSREAPAVREPRPKDLVTN